jgi:hypothetical protein
MSTTPYGVDGHDVDRPSWVCRECGVPFPCGPAREALSNSLGPIPLAMLMWSALDAATSDLGTTTRGGQSLFDRFIRWTRSRPSNGPAATELDLWRGYRSVVAMRRETRQTSRPHDATSRTASEG